MPASTAATSETRNNRARNRGQRPSRLPVELPRWLSATWLLALASSLALWLPLSPLNWSLVAWIAPVGWLLLIRQEKLNGRWPYLVLYLAGFVHWLLVMEGIRLAYWALYFGWIALAAYLAAYLPVFVGLSRMAVHRLRWPLAVVAPVVWVGLELVRGYMITGFSMGLLGHTQAGWTPLIQIADLAGAYAVSFLVMLVAGCLVQALPSDSKQFRPAPMVAGAVVLAAAFGYGQWRMGQTPPGEASGQRPLRAAIVQGSVDTIFDVPPERFVETYSGYWQAAVAAARRQPDLDVIVWPESVFMSSYPEVLLDRDATIPPGVDVTYDQFQRALVARQADFLAHAGRTARAVNASAQGERQKHIAQVVGTLTLHYKADRVEHYNSALLLTPSGKIQGRYYKMHPVMFGEYIPFGDIWPGIYKLTPMPGGLTRGRRAEVFQIAGYRLSPSICFESTVPHLIARQVRELARRGEPVDMLVNVTNDGWFWGSGVLDLHQKCAVFRAVEHHKPMLVAANTGFSLVVDGDGRVRKQGPRRAEEMLVADVLADGRVAPYTRYGDWPAGVCLAACIVIALSGLRRNKQPAIGAA